VVHRYRGQCRKAMAAIRRRQAWFVQEGARPRITVCPCSLSLVGA
jgi:hypothetical protein